MTPKEMFLEAMRINDGGDHEGFLARQAPDAHWTVPGAELHGRDELRGWLGQFWQSFSSYRHDLSRVEEVGSTVFAEGTWTGVNDGPLAMPDGTEVPATGRTVSFRFGMSVDGDVEAQQATAVRIYFDQLDFLGQLGLIPEPAGAPTA
jgi:ketosteroid isomerase-like protein